MKQRFSIFGATAGFVFGLLVVLLSDGTSPSAGVELATRGVVLCTFLAIGAAAGLLVGWVVGHFFRKR